MTDPVPASYRERIRTLESDLDRSVCGYPTEEGSPCRQWPVDEDGRCSRHSGKDLRDPFESGTVSIESSSTQSGDTIEETAEEPAIRDPRDWKYTLTEMARKPTYWVLLVVLGLVSGTAYGTIRYPTTGNGDANQGTVQSIDVDNPDFKTIREWFRSGNHTRVRSGLNEIYENSSNPSSRARALYYRYVHNQQLGNHQSALSDAETFLEKYDDHPLRPEVLFGAWFLSHRMLDRPEQAQKYEQQLRSEYPDSKWVQKINS